MSCKGDRVTILKIRALSARRLHDLQYFSTWEEWNMATKKTPVTTAKTELYVYLLADAKVTEAAKKSEALKIEAEKKEEPKKIEAVTPVALVEASEEKEAAPKKKAARKPAAKKETGRRRLQKQRRQKRRRRKRRLPEPRKRRRRKRKLSFSSAAERLMIKIWLPVSMKSGPGTSAERLRI